MRIVDWAGDVTLPPSLLMLCSVVSVQFGQAFGKTLFDMASPTGIILLRLGIAALLLLNFYRPTLPTDRHSWILVVGMGTAIAGMNIVYLALAYLPVGIATTLQLLGPLTLALATSRRWIDAIWGTLAGIGVMLFILPGWQEGSLSVAGIVLALFSGASMAAYVLFSSAMGKVFKDGSGLTLAVCWAALLFLPFGMVQNGMSLLSMEVVLSGVGVALLSAVIPYSMELAALRRITPRKVGILQSFEPACGALAGLLIVGESLTLFTCAAIGCVTLASIGVVSARDRPHL